MGYITVIHSCGHTPGLATCVGSAERALSLLRRASRPAGGEVSTSVRRDATFLFHYLIARSESSTVIITRTLSIHNSHITNHMSAGELDLGESVFSFQ
jgi:hypothetical protein